MPETQKIYAALAAVMADVDHVAKRDVNQHQNFRFRGIDAVVNAVGPVLRKHKVIVVPDVESVTYAEVTTSTNKRANACRVVVAYTFYAVDGSTVVSRAAGEAWDHGDKATPKAMSVAFRTALLQALALPTDDPDPDSHTYEGVAAVAKDKDWDWVADTAESLQTRGEVKRLWMTENVGRAPQVIKDRVNKHALSLPEDEPIEGQTEIEVPK